MNLNNRTVEINQELIKILDDLLVQGEWESSLFLQVTSKRLQKLRGEAKELLEKVNKNESGRKQAISHFGNDGYTNVYLSLYQSDGANFSKWQQLINNLANFSMSRPVYAKEELVQRAIKNKLDPMKEGYVIVRVRNDSIIHEKTSAEDRLGNPLLTLREKSVRLENVMGFVHNKKRYELEDGVLRKVSEMVE